MDEKKLYVSVVVPVYIKEPRHISMTERCLALAKNCTSIDFELVIVETESDYFKEYADVYVYEKVRQNPARSINRGFYCCHHDNIVLLTNDVMVSDGWLERLSECFNKPDCGLATLASTQFFHKKEEKIEEGVWFSVAMMKKRKEYFDERFKITWNDTDLIMRIYKEGFKMYRNFGCVVEHNPGTTVYSDVGLSQDFDRGRALFIEKHFDSCKDMPMFQYLTGGVIV